MTYNKKQEIINNSKKLRDYEKEYQESEQSKTMNRLYYGLEQVAKLTGWTKRSLLKKNEYHKLLKCIEVQLFNIL